MDLFAHLNTIYLVVVQLVERLLPTSEVLGSNPVIGKISIELNIYFLSTVLKRRK